MQTNALIKEECILKNKNKSCPYKKLSVFYNSCLKTFGSHLVCLSKQFFVGFPVLSLSLWNVVWVHNLLLLNSYGKLIFCSLSMRELLERVSCLLLFMLLFCWPSSNRPKLCKLVFCYDLPLNVAYCAWSFEFTTYLYVLNTLRTGLLNCLNARSRGLTFRHRASSI